LFKNIQKFEIQLYTIYYVSHKLQQRFFSSVFPAMIMHLYKKTF